MSDVKIEKVIEALLITILLGFLDALHLHIYTFIFWCTPRLLLQAKKATYF